jgi:hypothetical protein
VTGDDFSNGRCIEAELRHQQDILKLYSAMRVEASRDGLKIVTDGRRPPSLQRSVRKRNGAQHSVKHLKAQHRNSLIYKHGPAHSISFIISRFGVHASGCMITTVMRDQKITKTDDQISMKMLLNMQADVLLCRNQHDLCDQFLKTGMYH